MPNTTETIDDVMVRLVRPYMVAHPEAWDGVKRATYAYHDPDLSGCHRFAGDWREATCIDCGRSREQVRWDSAPECEGPASARLHAFSGSAPWAKCRHCEESREQVTTPTCAKWRSQSDIMDIMRAEEDRFGRFFVRTQKLIETLDIRNLTGEQLSHIHHTHGIDPSMVETAMMDAGHGSLSDELMAAYEKAYDAHCAIGSAAHKAPVLVAKTL